MPPELSRRSFLQLGAAAGTGFLAAGALSEFARREVPGRLRRHAGSRAGISGEIVGADARGGHLLRDGTLFGRRPVASERHDVVIVGAGVAGLAAAWRLRSHGVADVCVLELGRAAGGNSRGGLSAVSPFPWGAHYIRAPTSESGAVSRFLEQVGVIRGRDGEGRPDFDLRAVCVAPQERLFVSGQWHAGLFPDALTDADARAQLMVFEGLVDKLAARRDAAGRRAFALPVWKSARDADLLAWDEISFAQWLSQQGITAPSLLWLLDFGCRDDYGTTLETTSAWAGLHYHVARRDLGRDHENLVLRWPEGNARLVQLLIEAAGVEVRPANLVHHLEPEAGDGVAAADSLELDTGRVVRHLAPRVIFCGPRFVLPRLLEDPVPGVEAFTYAPWVVANLTLKRLPRGEGVPLARDNVIHGSQSLGYVVATHGRVPAAGPTVVTWYLPLTAADPAEARRQLLGSSWSHWRDVVLEDMERAHPGISDDVERIDVWRWGHAMIRPQPGFIWGEARRQASRPVGRLLFANSELGGLPLFEEAFDSGVAAAEEVLEVAPGMSRSIR